MNNRISAKERGLLKGAIRRVFSRSELRRRALSTVGVEHFDGNRPRVKKWSWCTNCGEVIPTYLLQVDHIDPIIPINSTLESMSWDIVVDRTWCEENNLAPTCKSCHTQKTKAENKERRLYKKGLK